MLDHIKVLCYLFTIGSNWVHVADETTWRIFMMRIKTKKMGIIVCF